MTFKSDKWILDKCTHAQLLDPFESKSIRKTDDGLCIPSYGVSSYGYDVRCATEFKRIKLDLANDAELDATKDCSTLFETVVADSYRIPAHGFVLCRTVERIKIPPRVTGICLGKSTMARLGLIVNATPLESEWEGFLVLELSNTTGIPIRVHAGQGIAQILFSEGEEDCIVSYKARNGKYMNQNDVVLAKL